MADPSDSAETPAGRLAREQTLARLMKAAAVLAAGTVEPGSRLDDIESTYQSCLSIVLNEYLRLIDCGFVDDSDQAVSNYAAKIRSIARFP
jgi:hypothetical protein